MMPANSITSPTTGDQAISPQNGFVNAAAAYPPPVQDDVVLDLQNRIRQTETAQRVGQGKIISSGCEAIDRLLPGRGYSPGTLVQWLVPDVLTGSHQITGGATGEIQPGGHAADYLSLLAAIEACKDGRSLVVLDPWHQFYPLAVAALGVDMANLIILRSQSSNRQRGFVDHGVPRNGAPKNGVSRNDAQTNDQQTENDLYWAIDQSLRCSAVGAVWGPIGSIDQRWFRRFQLSSESSGCLGLFIQSAKEAKQPSWAEVQWLVGGTNTNHPPTARSPITKSTAAATKTDRLQRVKLRLLRCRGGKAGRSVEVGVDAVTSQVQPCGGV